MTSQCLPHSAKHNLSHPASVKCIFHFLGSCVVFESPCITCTLSYFKWRPKALISLTMRDMTHLLGVYSPPTPWYILVFKQHHGRHVSSPLLYMATQGRVWWSLSQLTHCTHTPPTLQGNLQLCQPFPCLFTRNFFNMQGSSQAISGHNWGRFGQSPVLHGDKPHVGQDQPASMATTMHACELKQTLYTPQCPNPATKLFQPRTKWLNVNLA